MEDGWDFSRLVKEASLCVVDLSHFVSHLYKGHNLFFGVWYGSSATSWDRNEFIKGSIGVVDFRGKVDSILI